MNEPTDYEKEAANLIEVGIESMVLRNLPHANSTFAVAQVHATLALVEQQRIANLIALFALAPSGSAARGAAEDFADEVHNHLADEPVRKALGLS